MPKLNKGCFIPCIERRAELYNPHNYDYSIIFQAAEGNKYMLGCPNDFYSFSRSDFKISEEGDYFGFKKMEELTEAISSAIRFMLDRRVKEVNSHEEPPRPEDWPDIEVAFLVYMTPDDYYSDPCGFHWTGLLHDAIEAACIENNKELFAFHIDFFKMPMYGFTPPGVPSSDPYEEYEKWLKATEDGLMDGHSDNEPEPDAHVNDGETIEQSKSSAPSSTPADKKNLRDHIEAMFERKGTAKTPQEKFSEFLTMMYEKDAAAVIEEVKAKGYYLTPSGEKKRIQKVEGWRRAFNGALYAECDAAGLEDKMNEIRYGKSLKDNRNFILLIAFKLKMSAEETKTLFELGGLPYEAYTDEEDHMMYLIEHEIYEYKTRELETQLQKFGYPDIYSLAGISKIKEEVPDRPKKQTVKY